MTAPLSSTASDVTLRFGRFFFGPTGMSVNEGREHESAPSFEAWQSCGEWLRGVERRVQFWIGDWVNYGRERWGERSEQGIATEAEALASEATGWKPETVEQYARVARQVAPERRVADLPFSHHREVADLPPAEQTTWLARAQDENLSTDRLRAKLREAKGGEVDRTCWVVVRCADEEDREKLVSMLRGLGREVKLP